MFKSLKAWWIKSRADCAARRAFKIKTTKITKIANYLVEHSADTIPESLVDRLVIDPYLIERVACFFCSEDDIDIYVLTTKGKLCIFSSSCGEAVFKVSGPWEESILDVLEKAKEVVDSEQNSERVKKKIEDDILIDAARRAVL